MTFPSTPLNILPMDVKTIAIIISITNLLQIIVISFQFKVNKAYKGIGWWLLGFSSLAMGYGLIFLRGAVSIKFISIIVANSCILLAPICYYIGVMRFFEKKENRPFLLSVLTFFILSFLYFTYINDNISFRTFIVCGAVAAVVLSGSYSIFFLKARTIRASAYFIAILFLVQGSFFLFRAIETLTIDPVVSLFNPTTIQITSFLFQFINGLLLTFGFILMVNHRLNTDNQEDKENLELIFNTSPDAVLITRMDTGIVVKINAGFTTLTLYSESEIVGKTLNEVKIWTNPVDREDLINLLNKKGFIEHKDYIFCRKDGTLFNGMVYAKVIMIKGVTHIISVTHNITEQKKTEQSLWDFGELYRSILNASPDNITITNTEGIIAMVSPVALIMNGCTEDELLGHSILDFLFPEDRELASTNIDLMLQGIITGLGEYRGLRPDGSIFDMEMNGKFIRGTDGNPTQIVFIIREITERKRAEGQIQELIHQLEQEKNYALKSALTDGLTALPNRRHFDQVLNTEFYRLKRSKLSLSLIMIDIDHFKDYNDQYGHVSGDDCLRQVATALDVTTGRAPDLVARYGGEEFVAILPETDNAGATVIAERLRKVIEDLGIPHAASGTKPFVTISLGVATLFPNEVDTPEQIIKLADSALYYAKQGGRNRVEIASNDLNRTPIYELLVWHANDECGNTTIDAQHKKLFEHSNKLISAISENLSKEKCDIILHQLIEEIMHHFNDEEAIISSAQYPFADAHHHCHADLILKAANLAQKYDHNELKLAELYHFLVFDIVSQHLLLEDKKFFPFI